MPYGGFIHEDSAMLARHFNTVRSFKPVNRDTERIPSPSQSIWTTCAVFSVSTQKTDERLVFRKRLAATQTAKSLGKPVFILQTAETLGFALTTITIHFGVAVLSAWVYSESESPRFCPLGFGLWICHAVLQHRRAFLV